MTDRTADFSMEDLTHVPEEARESALHRYLHGEARRSFDLARDVLLRAALVSLAEHEHALLLVIHHVATDGWSDGILARELAALYEAFAAARPSPLPPLSIEYPDFAIWQRERLSGERLARGLAYWKDRLAGAPETLGLPTDRPRLAHTEHRGARLHLGFSPTFLPAVEALGREARTTLFMTLLAAFQAFLHRYTGEEDILVASPVAGRPRVETEGLIGFFANTVVFRTSLAGDPSFRELLGRVRETALEAYSHLDVPFERLIAELAPDRHLSRAPLAPVLFGLHRTSGATLGLPGLSSQPIDVGSGSSKGDLTLILHHTDHGLEGYLEYDADLFEEPTARRMAGHWRRFLEGAIADPDSVLSRLPLLDPAERHLALVDWNATRRDYPDHESLDQLFAAQAARTPDSVALVSSGQTLTYRELHQRVRRVASHLRSLGVGPEVRVGVLMERSAEFVTAVVGVIEAGGPTSHSIRCIRPGGWP